MKSTKISKKIKSVITVSNPRLVKKVRTIMAAIMNPDMPVVSNLQFAGLPSNRMIVQRALIAMR